MGIGTSRPTECISVPSQGMEEREINYKQVTQRRKGKEGSEFD
jgi:hypothetical protein